MTAIRFAGLFVLAGLIQAAPFAAYSHSTASCNAPCCTVENSSCCDEGASCDDHSSCYTCDSHFSPYATLTNPSPDNSARRQFQSPHHPFTNGATPVSDIHPTVTIDNKFPPGPLFLMPQISCTVLRL
ncbi:MAG: hypothetical protein JXA71_05255 [Chitinispirillaceae bacterium]|nr:hypothetical protein [Chitinispirillaceae bacterium]